jgi:cytochrome o ubiquinol oxidase subunit II
MATKHTSRKRTLAAIIAVVVLLGLIGWYLSSVSIPVLQPAGPIAAGEERLMVLACLLMLIVVIPVFIMAFGFAWRYRESNTKRTVYAPEWDHSRLAEAIWWLIPIALISLLSVITWHASHDYDPYKPLASKEPALQVQAVAMQWRWVFISPGQHVASINVLHMPVGRPVTFHITADAPMNSFWIPQLGGQIYAMPGMDTQLNLEAGKAGIFYGSSANISGTGFADMHFNVIANSSQDFASWVNGARQQTPLTLSRYRQLAKPTDDPASKIFSDPADDLYETVINKYMAAPGIYTEDR